MSFLKQLLLILLLVANIQLIAQDDSNSEISDTEESIEDVNKKETYDFKKLLEPEIGLGIGIMTHLGEVGFNEFTQPLQNKIGINGDLTYHLTESFDANMHLHTGFLYGNNSNVNFRTLLRTFQLDFSYNFRNLYKRNDFKLNPYIYAGVSGIFFQTKLDLNSYAGAYYFWNDGTVRDREQTSANESLANTTAGSFIITQDYAFETNARQINYNGLGAYPTFVLGVPVGVGLRLKLTKHLSAKFATTATFAYSDIIDGTTSLNFTIRKGTELNDIYLYTHYTLAYDFGAKSEGEENYEGVDYLALAEEDTDGDGVKDFEDECEETSPDAIVDIKGCPLDEDEDGVPDYKDQELTTAAGAFVNKNGVTLNQDELAARFQVYIDSTGKYIPTSMLDAGKMVYKVQILEGEIPEDQLEQFLALDGLETRVLPDGTQKHTYGIYTKKEDAQAKAKELEDKGFLSSQVIEEAFEPERIILSFAHEKANFGTGSQSPNDDGGIPIEITPNEAYQTDGIPNEQGLIYRIQIGAFSKSVPSSAFKGVPVIAAPAGNGITRYLTGNFKNYQAAASRKQILSDNGFEGAYVVAYKDGKRVSVSNAARLVELNKNSSNSTSNSIPDVNYTDDIKYRVQIGAYKGVIPANIINNATNLSKETLGNGITRYFSGNFDTYNEAVDHRKSLSNKGIQGAFITAYKTGNKISLKETGDYNETEIPSNESETTKTNSKINANTVVFKIQLGLYQDAIPNSELSKFLVIKNIKAEQTNEGATRYTAGSFDNINEARQYKQDIDEKGISGAFIIAFSEGNQIPLEDAINATSK